MSVICVQFRKDEGPRLSEQQSVDCSKLNNVMASIDAMVSATAAAVVQLQWFTQFCYWLMDLVRSKATAATDVAHNKRDLANNELAKQLGLKGKVDADYLAEQCRRCHSSSIRTSRLQRPSSIL